MSDSIESTTTDLAAWTVPDPAKSEFKDSIVADVHFSRSCGVCFNEAPRQRNFFKGCGHIICRACAEQLILAAWSPSCPFCRAVSKVVPLIEEPGNDYDDLYRTIARNRRNALIALRPVEYSAEYRELLVLRLGSNEFAMAEYLEMHKSSLKTEAIRRGGASFEAVVRAKAAQILGSVVPHDASVKEITRYLGNYTITSVCRDLRRKFISLLRTENENSIVRQYSRACGVCSSTTLRNRCAFTECGHVVCSGCATHRQSSSCLVCHVQSAYVKLFENIIETSEKEK